MEYSQDELMSVLLKRFGHERFRKGQDEIIRAVLEKKNSLIVMPTGGGKSLCYQLPAIFLEGTAIIISPLIALMKDQVDYLEKINVPAAFINSSISFSENQRRMELAAQGNYKILYIAPERLDSSNFKDYLERIDISFLAVDEAHCISEWGHDFRPSYLKIPKAFVSKHDLQIIALTATATTEVQEDIVKSLGMNRSARFIRGFDRPNLNYITENCSEKGKRLAKLCQIGDSGSIIIYCGTRRRVEEFAVGLKTGGLNAEIYHAGLEDKQRKIVQDKFISGRSKIIVATNAFGMGIDKPDVRKVIHCDYTSTLEAYYQEAGRAGRDGLPSDCVLLHNSGDVKLQEFFIDMTYPPLHNIENVYDTIFDEAGAKIGQKPQNPIFLDDYEIGVSAKLYEKLVSSALSLLERCEIIKRNSTFSRAKIKIETTRERILEYYNSTTQTNRQILEALLRSLSADVYYREIEIDIDNVISKYRLDSKQFASSLQSFQYANLIKYMPAGAPGGISFLLERAPFKRLPIDFDDYAKRRKRSEKKLAVVLRYAETKECKRNYILNYFQDNETEGVCGKCSSCAKPVSLKASKLKKSAFSDETFRIALSAAAELNGRFGKAMLSEYLKGSATKRILEYGMFKGHFYAKLGVQKTADIRILLDEAISLNLLEISSDLHPVVHLTKNGINFLGTPPQPLRINFNFQKKENNGLHGVLKIHREKLSQSEAIVPRGIISDKALLILSEIAPEKISDLKGINGLSAFFIEKYGKSFIQVIKEYLSADDSLVEQKTQIESSKNRIDPKFEVIFNTKNLEEIADKTSTSIPEASQLVQSAIEQGIGIDIGKYIEMDDYQEVKHFMINHPRAALREVRIEMKSEISYPALRIAVALARKEIGKK